MQHDSDLWLLALVRSGDKEAFSQLMTHYQPMALRLAIQMIGSQEIATDTLWDWFNGPGTDMARHLTFETVGLDVPVTVRSGS